MVTPKRAFPNRWPTLAGELASSQRAASCWSGLVRVPSSIRWVSAKSPHTERGHETVLATFPLWLMCLLSCSELANRAPSHSRANRLFRRTGGRLVMKATASSPRERGCIREASWNREPSGSRASTHGDDSSTRRPRGPHEAAYGAPVPNLRTEEVPKNGQYPWTADRAEE